MSRQSTDHTVFDARASQLRCTHCGASEPVTLPIAITDFCNATNKFVKAHRNCQPTGIDSEGGSHD